MKTLKEIETEIEETRTQLEQVCEILGIRGEWYCPDSEKSKLKTRLEGWLVGLGMAKGISGTSYLFDDRYKVREMKEPKTPYEQGIKEALEWCLK